MRIVGSISAFAALNVTLLAALSVSAGPALAAEEGIAGYCLYFHENSIYYRSPVFRAAKFDRHRFVEDWKHHLYESGVNYFNGVTCRAWPGGADAVASAAAAAATPPEYTQRIVDVDWIPKESVRAFGGGSAPLAGSARPNVATPRSASSSKPTPVKPTPYPSKYVEVAGPNGIVRLSPEVAARNQAAADDYRRKMEEHSRASAEHDQRLAQHRRNAATAASAEEQHKREVAAAAERYAAYQVAMADHARKVSGASTNDDPNTCITRPEFRSNDGLPGNTSASVINGCPQKVDIVLCLRRNAGDWTCGAKFGILPQGKMSYATLNATGEIFVDAITYGGGGKLKRPAGM